MQDNLEIILCGGQTFSWTKEEDCYSAVLNGKVWRIKEFSDIKDEYLKNYFDLDFDYVSVREELKAKDEYLKEAIEQFPSLRILKQEPFIAMISFILSQNNNIKRIKLIYDKLSKNYGTEIEEGYYSFPTASQLKDVSVEDFNAMGTGFRSRYLVDAINKVEILDEIPTRSYEEAKERLMSIVGIGPKVADCILLFGFHRLEAFPLDVWMKKVMNTYYKGKDVSYFGSYPALAQQYLFSWIREKETN